MWQKEKLLKAFVTMFSKSCLLQSRQKAYIRGKGLINKILCLSTKYSNLLFAHCLQLFTVAVWSNIISRKESCLGSKFPSYYLMKYDFMAMFSTICLKQLFLINCSCQYGFDQITINLSYLQIFVILIVYLLLVFCK